MFRCLPCLDYIDLVTHLFQRHFHTGKATSGDIDGSSSDCWANEARHVCITDGSYSFEGLGLYITEYDARLLMGLGYNYMIELVC